jgi:signal transduction histidine kinase
LGSVALVACVALVLLTTLLRREVDEMDRSQEAARLASNLAHHTLQYEFERTPTGRALSQAEGRVLLARGATLVRTPEARAGFDRLTTLLERYWRSPGTDGQLPQELITTLLQVEDRLAVRARAKSDEAKTLDMISNVLGVAIAVLLAAGVLAFLWWIHQFVFRPIQSLVATVDRFAGGDRMARAEVRGAEEIRRIAATQNEMADALARTREDQLRYVATVVHDLRNPLAAVQLAVGYVTPERPLPPEHRLRQVFDLIGRQLKRLNSLVGDVLNAVQVEAGDIVLRRAVCDLGDLARECVALFRTMSPYHNFEIACDGSTALLADPTRLEQVLNNLVSNAVKYSPQGSVVWVDVRGDGERLFLSVTDEGPGLSPEQLRQIFRPFSRGPSEHEEIAGVGLGLYVSKRIVEAHGGTLEALSAGDRGMTFRMVLPRGDLAESADGEPVGRPQGEPTLPAEVSWRA